MDESEMMIYLKEFLRILTPDGKVFFTAFIEKGVQSVSYNPEGYVFAECEGPLMLVRYERDYLSALLRRLGYTILNISEPGEGIITSAQRSIYLERAV